MEFKKYEEALKQKCPDSVMKELVQFSESFYLNLVHETKVDLLEHQITLTNGGNTSYICNVCLKSLKNGTLPPKYLLLHTW